MQLGNISLRLIVSGLLVLSPLYADESPVYELPSVGVSAAPPFLYQNSPILGNQVIISKSQIVRSGANDIGQLIGNISGVQYITGVSAEPEILIHSEPALILVNGQPLTNISMSNPDISLIPLSEIEQIIITPGGAGTIYGNQSLGGAINIITTSPTQPAQSLSVGGGTPWSNQIIGISAGPINASTAYRADVQNQFDEGDRENSRENTGQGNFSFEKDNRSGSVVANADFMRQTMQLPGYLTDVQAESNPTQSFASQGQGTYQANTGLFGLVWTEDFNALWQMKINLSDRLQDATSNLDGIFTQKYNTLMLNPELEGRFILWNRPIDTSFGLAFSNEGYRFESPDLYSNISGSNQQQYSSDASLNVPLTAKISLAGSGRLVAVETEGQFFNNATLQFNPESSQSQTLALGTIGLNAALNSETIVYIRRAMGYQLPFIDESNLTANPGAGFGLQPTTSTAYESGINWQGAEFQWDAEAFLINLQNEIGFYTPQNGLAANYNLSPTRREGITGDLSDEIAQKWTLGGSATLMNNFFETGVDAGNKIPGASNVLLDFNARYQVNSIWSVYGESQYVGPEFAEGDNANVSSQVPGYWVENLAINAEFSAWLLSLRVDNLTNQLYYSATVYAPYITAANNNPVAYYPANGRTAVLTCTYRFN